ncbi:hypothetical protein D3C75_807260 [compost metagenome]
MKRGYEQITLTGSHNLILIDREYINIRPDLFNERSTNKDSTYRLADSFDFQITFKAFTLASKGIPGNRNIHQLQMRGLAAINTLSQYDHSGACPKNRLALAGKIPDRLYKAIFAHKLANRRALTARNDQSLDLFQLFCAFNWQTLRSSLFYTNNMLCYCALKRQHPYLHRDNLLSN